jgi:uncharacterized membrane protein YdbT with pleckstrin-like domain
MKKYKDLLAPHEKLVHVANLHWSTQLDSIFIFLIGLVLYYLSFVYLTKELRDFMNIMITLMILYGGFRFLLEYLRHRSSFFLITNERILIQIGLFRTSSMAIALRRIQTVEVSQTLWGQILGFGTIKIVGIGINTLNKFEMVDKPHLFRQKLQVAIDGRNEDSSSSSTHTKIQPTKPSPKPRR